MSDATAATAPMMGAPPPRQYTSRRGTLNDTASISLSTVGAAGVIKWIFECYQAKMLLTPDDQTLTLLAGFVLPVVHAGRDAILKLIHRYN